MVAVVCIIYSQLVIYVFSLIWLRYISLRHHVLTGPKRRSNGKAYAYAHTANQCFEQNRNENEHNRRKIYRVLSFRQAFDCRLSFYWVVI